MKKLLGYAGSCVLGLLSGQAFAGNVSFADLARHMQYDEVKISGDGKYIAVSGIVDDKPALSLIDLETHKGVTIRPREDRRIVHYWWVNNHRVLYTESTKVSGFDQPFSTGEIFGVNADGTAPAVLFGIGAGRHTIGGHGGASLIHRPEAEFASGEVIDRLKNDEEHVLIKVTSWRASADGDFPKIFLMNVRDGTKTQVGTAPVRNAKFLVDHKGVVRFASGNDIKDMEQVYYRADDGESWSKLFSETPEEGVSSPLAFSRDDSVVYVTCAVPGMAGAICPWDVKTRTLGQPVWTSDTVNTSELVQSLDGQDIVAARSMPGMPATSALVPGADTVALIGKLSKQFPGEDIRLVSSTDDGSKAVVLVQSDIDPGAFYLWDAKAGKSSLLFERAKWIKSDLMASMQPVEFKARDGMTLHGYLSTPPGKEDAKHLPLVVYVHGGPIGLRDRWGYDPYIQMMTTRGYAVLQVNFRGSGGYGFNFQRAGYREWGGKMQDDVTDATRWAIEKNIATPDRICIFGGSYGGYAALEGAVKEPKLYKCAIGYVGVYDLSLMYTKGDASDSVASKSFLRDALGSDPDKLAARSPINQLDSLKANVMLIVGGQDTRVPPQHGENLHAALQKRGIAHEWLYKPDEGHGFYDERNTVELFERVSQFLDRNIGTGVGAAGAP